MLCRKRSEGRGRLVRRLCGRRGGALVVVTMMLMVVHRLLPFFLVIGQQGVNLVVRVVADGVNLRSKLLPRRFRIFIEQRLNPIMMLLKQRAHLLLLFWSQLQIFRELSEFFVDRFGRVGTLTLRTR